MIEPKRFSRLLTIGLALLPAAANAADSAPALTVTAAPGLQTPTAMTVSLNKSQVLRANQTIRKITVGNPAIADVSALSDRSFYVLGKSLGTTNLAIYGQNGSLVAVTDVIVGVDIQGVKVALNDVMPQEKIEVRAINDTHIREARRDLLPRPRRRPRWQALRPRSHRRPAATSR
jgi:pilus assembly protein CpaC